VKTEEKAKAVVTFVVGPYRFCIPATEVVSVITKPAMSKLPCDAGSVEGVFDHHGKVATAVSLRRKFGLKNRNGESDVWILAHITPGLTAFRVDKIIDLVAADSLQWQQIHVLSPISAVDQFALSDKEIFLSSNCESLFAMPDMANQIEIVDDHDVIESDETEPERHMPGQLVTDTKPDDDSASRSVNDDTAVTRKSMNMQADSENDVPVPAPGETKSIISSDLRCDDQPLQPEPSAVSRRGSNYRHDRENRRLPRSERGKCRKHMPAKNPAIPHMQKVALRRAGTAKPHPVREMRQDDYGRDSSRKKHFFDLPISLGILTVVAILLWVCWLLPSGKNERAHSVQSSPALIKVTSYRNGPAVTGTDHDKSLPIGPEDHEPDNNFVPSFVPLEKILVENDADKKTTPPDRQKSEEVLRVETKNITVTVDRPTISQKESRTQMVASAYPHEGVMHIVVKGDTLWDVARHYLGDPFRYPELAAVSQIRDPHWIYPNDIIRIIKK
jgi:chemotaxis signal transduction protein/nucleoid-associated protein YgaU